MRLPRHQRLRPPPHRLLRLLLAAGGAATGLCLVLGLVTFVITMGPGPHATPDASARATASPGGGGTKGNGGGHSLMLKGNGGAGQVKTQPITVPARWGLHWSFRCPDGHPGAFAVHDAGPNPADHVAITASGESGEGTWWDLRGPGVHVLRITAGCPWRARIVLPDAGQHHDAGLCPARCHESGRQGRGQRGKAKGKQKGVHAHDPQNPHARHCRQAGRNYGLPGRHFNFPT
jgi:hypothetical protein